MHSNVHVGQLSVIDDFVWIFPYVVLTNDKSISFDDVTYSLKKSEISIDEPQFIILGWY